MTSPAGGFNLGNAHGYVDIDASGVNRGLDSGQRAFNNFISNTGQQMQQWGTQIAGFGAQLSMLTAPLAMLGAASINTVADFDSVMTRIQVQSGATTEEMEIIRQTITDLGRDTVFSMQEGADAFLNLRLAGLTVEEALATIPHVLNAAAAGGMQLGQSADYITGVMASFGIEADQSVRVVEAMSRAASSSNVSMADMGEALADIGGDARTFGLSLDQTASALAILGNVNIRGSEAATQMRSMFTAMISPSEATATAWQMVGSSLFDVNGNTRDFAVVLNEVEAGLANLNAEDRAFVIQNLAGSFGRVGFNALLASDGIVDMQETMSQQTSAADVASAMMDTFKGTMDGLMGSIEALSITVMTPFMNDVLRPLADYATNLVNVFAEWADANQPLVQSFLMVGAALIVLGPTLMVVGGLISGIGTALVFLSSPIALIIGGVALLGYAFVTNFMGIRDAVMVVWDAFQLGLQGFSSFGDLLAETGDYVGATIGAITSFIMNFAIGLGMPAQAALQMRDSMRDSFDGIRDAVMGAWAQIQPVLAMIGAWFINDVVPQIVSIVTGSFIPLLQSIGTTLSDLWLITQPQLTALWDWFTVTALPGVMTFISSTVMPGIQLMIDTLNNLWITVSPYLIQLYDWFMTTALPSVIGFINGTVIPAVQLVIDTLSNIWIAVSPYLTRFYDWFITNGLPPIQAFISGPFTSAVNTVVGVVQGFLDLINRAISAASNFVNNNGISGAVNTVAGALGVANPTTSVGRTDYSTTSTGGFSAGNLYGGSRDSGGSGEAGRAYMIGTGAQPELFMPGTNGSFIPNADRLMGGSGGMNFEQGSVVINANSYREGREAARGFSDVIMERFRETN